MPEIRKTQKMFCLHINFLSHEKRIMIRDSIVYLKFKRINEVLIVCVIKPIVTMGLAFGKICYVLRFKAVVFNDSKSY